MAPLNVPFVFSMVAGPSPESFKLASCSEGRLFTGATKRIPSNKEFFPFRHAVADVWQGTRREFVGPIFIF